MNREKHIRLVHEMRRESTKGAIRRAIALMRAEGLPVTFPAISRRTGLSVGTLYYHGDIKDEIFKAREDGRAASASRAAVKGLGSAREMHEEVLRLTKRVSELEEERDRLYDICLEPCWEFDYEDSG